MAISPGVIGVTRSEMEEAAKQRMMQSAQLGATVAGQIADRRENARQFNVATGLPAAMGSSKTLFEALQTTEGRAAIAPFLAQLTGIQDPAQLEAYMVNVARSPQDFETLSRAAQNAFATGRVAQGSAEAVTPTPDYVMLAKGAADKYQRQGAVVPEGAPPASFAAPQPTGDRTLASIPPKPTTAVYGSELAQPQEGQVTGAGYKAVFVPAMRGYVLLDSTNRRVTPNRTPGAFATPEAAFTALDDALRTNTASLEGETSLTLPPDAKIVEHPATSVLTMTPDQLRATIADKEASGIVRDAAANRLRSLETPATAAPTSITTSYYGPDGKLKTAAAAPTAISLSPDMSFRQFALEKQRRGALGGTPINPQGTDDKGLASRNEGTYKEWELYRRGQTPAWATQGAVGSASPAAAAVTKATAEGAARLSEDDKLRASYYFTKTGDTEAMKRAGLTPLSPAEMVRAERLLVSEVKTDAADVTRKWRALPKGSAVDQELAAQHAQTLQIIGGDLPAELNPMLTQVMTNWADLDRRKELATIKQLETSAGLNEAQAKYYLDRLRVEAAGDTMDYMARMDEQSKKLLSSVVDLFNGVYKDTIGGISKISDPEKRTQEIAKFVDADPILKTAFTAYQRSMSWMLNTPITPEFTRYLYGGFLGVGKKEGSTVLGSVELGGPMMSGLGTDAAGEAAGYSLE